MQVGDKVRVKSAASYFYGYEGIIIARDEQYKFPISVDFTIHKWPIAVSFNECELMVLP